MILRCVRNIWEILETILHTVEPGAHAKNIIPGAASNSEVSLDLPQRVRKSEEFLKEHF